MEAGSPAPSAALTHAIRAEATRRADLPYIRRSYEDARKALDIKQSFYEAALRNVNEGLYPEMIEGLARIAAERGTTPSEATARVCAEYAARALGAKADDARSLAFRGMVLVWLGDKEAGRADLEDAIARDVTLEPLVAHWIER